MRALKFKISTKLHFLCKSTVFVFALMNTSTHCVAYNVTKLAGSGAAGYADGAGTAAMFNQPQGVAVDNNGNLYVADHINHCIRMITPSGIVTTLAGSGTAGYADSTGKAASFNQPQGIAVDNNGNVYVGDRGNNRIRKIVIATGVVTTLAGSGIPNYADGTGTAAKFYQPSGVVYDNLGNLYVVDTYNHCIRKIAIATGVVSTLAGTCGSSGYVDAAGTTAKFYKSTGAAMDATGANLYVADYGNNCIRQINLTTGTVTTLAGSPAGGHVDGTGTAAKFINPGAIAMMTIDGFNSLFVADKGNNCIRQVTLQGVVTTFAGTTAVGSVDGAATTATFNEPYGISVLNNDIYVGDMLNHSIRKLTPSGIY